jgi:hypothetical protein
LKRGITKINGCSLAHSPSAVLLRIFYNNLKYAL